MHGPSREGAIMEKARADANRVAYTEFLMRLEQAMRQRQEEPTVEHKPIRLIARCAHCGRAKNQHRAGSLECPKGKRTATGYAEFGAVRFERTDSRPVQRSS